LVGFEIIDKKNYVKTDLSNHKMENEILQDSVAKNKWSCINERKAKQVLTSNQFLEYKIFWTHWETETRRSIRAQLSSRTKIDKFVKNPKKLNTKVKSEEEEYLELIDKIRKQIF
jgi:hypothetical protein